MFRHITWVSASQLQKAQLCWKPLHASRNWADVQEQGKGRGPPSSSSRKPSTHRILFYRHNQQFQRQPLLSLPTVAFLIKHPLGSPSNFTNSEMSFSLRTFGYLLLHSSAQARGHMRQQFSFYPKGQAGSSFPDNLLFRQQKLGLQRLSWNLNIQSYSFPFSNKPPRKHRTSLLQLLPPPPHTYKIIHFYLNSRCSCFLLKTQSLKMTSSTCHNPLCGRNRHTVSYCSLYNTLSCTFCSEHTETPLEATAISMQEAKENLVADLIQDKSMCTRLLLTVLISSRRDTVLEFQGYPRCLCIWKTYLALWDILRTPFERFPGVRARDRKSLNPGCFSPFSVRDFGKGHARIASPFLPSTEINISHSPQIGAGKLN